MREISIGFSTGRTFFSYLIRAFEGFIPYSHVFIRFKSVHLDRTLIYQASGLQVNFVSPIIFESKVKIIKEFKLFVSEESYKKSIQFAIDNAGVPYGYKQLIGMAIVRLVKMFGFKIKNPFSDGKTTYVCSELAGHILKGLLINVNLNLEDSGPKDLYNLIEKLTKNNT